jgi:hypothetical protein
MRDITTQQHILLLFIYISVYNVLVFSFDLASGRVTLIELTLAA